MLEEEPPVVWELTVSLKAFKVHFKMSCEIVLINKHDLHTQTQSPYIVMWFVQLIGVHQQYGIPGT